jgi:hypothetical protein
MLLAVGLLAMAVTALVLYSVLQNVQPGLQTGTAALTATARPATGSTGAHLQTNANTRAPDAAVAPVPADSAQLSTPAPLSSATARGQQQPAHGHATSKAGVSPPPMASGGPPAPQALNATIAGGPMFYKLPATLPTVPAEVPLSSLVPAPLSDRAVTRIVSRFPGMRPSAAPAGMDAYTVGRERLVLLPATGQVDYTAGTPPSGSRRSGSPAPETAILRAHTWLFAHALYPNDVDESATSVQQVGGVTSVRFTPATDLPLTGADAAISLIVNLDGSGKVIAAHRIWPQVQQNGSVAILPPSAAVSPAALASAPPAAPATAAPNAAAGAPRTFTVTDMILAYTPAGSQLRPVYVLTGTLHGAGLPSRAYTQTVPATAPARP